MGKTSFRELTRLVAPSLEPVSLLQAKRQLRLEHDDDDAEVLDYVAAAREHVEAYCWRAVYQQRWKATFDGFPAILKLPIPPLVRVESVKYLSGGAWATVDPTAYRVVKSDQGARLVATDLAWPSPDFGPGTVEVEYTTGYTTGSVTEDQDPQPQTPAPAADGDPLGKVPKQMKQAVLLLVSHFYENREATHVTMTGGGALTMPFGVPELLSMCRAVDDL